MKKISAETTKCMMGAIAYAINKTILVELTKEALDDATYKLMRQYCEREGIEPDYTGIYYL